MAKWGSLNSMVTNSDPKDFSRLPNFFDVIVVDAPCSGSGLFRKQEDAIEHWSEENVNHCSLRQQRILTDLLPSLKEDGILIYSTCSYSIEENENMCDYLCEHFSLESIKLKTETEWEITETHSTKQNAFGYRFFPHLTQGEGFFLACFKKKSADEINPNRNQHKLFKKISADENDNLKKLINTENLDFIKFYDDICGFNKSVTAELNKVTSALKIKKLPFHIGQLKGKDFVPHPYLAYQNIINDVIERSDVDVLTALQYLRKQPFTLTEASKGFALLTYKNFNLGWMKNLGNRINNYYPADWRILKEGF
jgi:NOL1/NOP2/fmu family ribosome biogenesis protein